MDIRKPSKQQTVLRDANLCSLALSHDANALAAADSFGKISVIKRPLKSSFPVVSTLHWHAHEVKALHFESANSLVSGGQEAVLVQWNLES